MKLIIAYIQPEQLNDVKQALYEKDVYKMSVTNAMGCGQQKGYHETYRGADIEVNLLKKVVSRSMTAWPATRVPAPIATPGPMIA